MPSYTQIGQEDLDFFQRCKSESAVEMQSVPSPWIRFTFNFYLFNQVCHLDFSQFENQIQRANTFYMVQFMDQSLEQRNSNKSLGDVQVPIKETDLINTNATITSLHPRMQGIWGDV